MPNSKISEPVNPYAEALGWITWPFRIVAEVATAGVWADRSGLKDDIAKRMRRLSALPHSTIQLLWADFGSGKSHTMRFMEHLSNERYGASVDAVYTETPPGCRSFLELFQSFAAVYDLDKLSSIGGDAGGIATQGALDLRQALRLSNVNNANTSWLAKSWFLAQRGNPHLKVLRASGIQSRIEDDNRAVEVLAEIVAKLNASGRRLLWLVDESQRVGAASKKENTTFKSMVSLFNRCPSGLHLVLSFSVAQQNTIDRLLPQDLRSRSGTFPTLALPNLERDEARVFLGDLFSLAGANKGENYPFTSDALDLLIGKVEKATGGLLTPRKLMVATARLLMDLIDADYAPPFDSDKVSAQNGWIETSE